MNDEWRLMNSTLLHRNKQIWTVPHPNRPSRFPPEQRTRRIEKDKTHPFHSPTDGTVSHLNRELDVVTSKKTKRIRSTSQRIDPFPISAESSTLVHRKRHRKRQDRTVPQNKTEPFHIPTDWGVSHLNRELDVAKKTKRIRSTAQQTEPFPIQTMNAEWWMMNARERDQLSVGGHQPIPV